MLRYRCGACGGCVLAPFVAPTERGRSVASEGNDPMYWLPSLFVARPASPVVRNGGGDPAALVGPCCCCKAQIHVLLCDASCHLPKCDVWVKPIGLRSLRGVHARARPSPHRQRSAENLPFSHSLKWQVRLPAHPALAPDANDQRACWRAEKITRFFAVPTFTAAYAGARTFFSHLSRAQWPRQGSPLADLVQNLRFQFFPRFAGFARTRDSRGRERYLKGSPGAARARSKPAIP